MFKTTVGFCAPFAAILVLPVTVMFAPILTVIVTPEVVGSGVILKVPLIRTSPDPKV